ncbi:uncharacterized protein P884DRAFT_303821 [Thermothelomyces heterothallicus CBS 202.75]|uniref:uncharacterized protein n=1 Tax=Thermothelomyces heterothallicus CBS 202.75 TaxID=1149848 RepID=UPI0037442D2E
MRFSVVTTLAYLGSVAIAQLSATVMVQSIKALTAKSQSLVVPAQQLNATDAKLLLQGQGPCAILETMIA